MLAAILKVLTIGGMTLGACAGYWLLGLKGPILALAVAGGLIAFFALPTSWTFALAAIGDLGKRQGPHLKPFQMVRLFVFEWYALFILYAFTQAWPGFFVRKGLPKKHSVGDRLIVLVHGFFCNRGSWVYLKPRLEKLGYEVATIDLEPPFGGIDALAESFRRSLDGITARAAPDEIVIVAHSMGGLVTRAHMERYGKGAIVKLITLATPYEGTAVAYSGAGGNVRDMRPGSKWLQQFSTFGASPVPTVCVWSLDDNIISPRRSALLRGARSIPAGDVGHLSMLFSRRLLHVLKEELAADDACAGRASTMQAQSAAGAANRG
jgi:triacylglycerol lipase